jgi:hypothetical protein
LSYLTFAQCELNAVLTLQRQMLLMPVAGGQRMIQLKEKTKNATMTTR